MQDRFELESVFAQDGIEAAAIFLCLYFTSVVLAHGGNFIGEENSTFEEIHFP